MIRFRNLFLFTLIGGLIAVEVFSGQIFPEGSAQSQHKLTAHEQSAILSILKNGLGTDEESPAPSYSTDFPSFTSPANPGEVAGDTLLSYGLITGTTTSPNPNISYGPTTTNTGDLLNGILPPVGTALYIAYQEGGRFWYGRGNDILVIYPDESIQSFNKKTGAATTWLQDRLALPPITTEGAYANYQKIYRAEIVAQTSTWVLMEFPSSEILKVAKPRTFATPSGGPAQDSGIYGLPTILPGYE